MSGYNGWSNYETWRVNLEMVDGMTLEDFVEFPESLSLNEDSDQAEYVAELIRDYCEDLVEQQVDGLSRQLGVEIAMAFLEMVNWREIADHLIMEPSV